MKNFLFVSLLIILMGFKIHAQVMFEPGYIITESNEIIECSIKNMEWRTNPSEIKVKMPGDAEIVTKGIEDIREFGINGRSRYIRSRVQIDKSGENLNVMSNEKNPVFQEELVFLSFLIEGSASLFLYKEVGLTRYFYKTEDSEIKQLVYKQYQTYDKSDKLIVKTNNQFRQQLLNEFRNLNIPASDVADLQYKKKDLMSFFKKVNKRKNDEYVDYTSRSKKPLFNLTLRPGINSSNLEIWNTVSARESEFDRVNSIRFGTEAEIIFPFNKNKWGILVEPTYQYYKTENVEENDNVSGGMVLSKVNYQSFELPLGVRHHFFLNNNSQIFLNFSYVLDFSHNSYIEFRRNDASLLEKLDIKPQSNLAMGFGYKYREKISLEMRYYTPRGLFKDYAYWNSDFQTFSFIIGWAIW